MSLDELLTPSEVPSLVRNTLARLDVRTPRELLSLDLDDVRGLPGVGIMKVVTIEELIAETARRFRDSGELPADWSAPARSATGDRPATPGLPPKPAGPAEAPLPADMPTLIIPLLARLGVDRLRLLAEVDLPAVRSLRGVGLKKWLLLRDVVNQARAQKGVVGPLVRSLGSWEGRTGPWSDTLRLPAELAQAFERAGITTLEAAAAAFDSGHIPDDPDDLLATLHAPMIQRLGEEIRLAETTSVERARKEDERIAERPRTFPAFYEAARAATPEGDWPALVLRARGGTLRQAGRVLGVSGERARQRIRSALDGIDASIRRAASELLEPLEAELGARVLSLDELLTERDLDSVATIGLACLLVDREQPQLRYGVITFSSTPLAELRARLLSQVHSAGWPGRALNDLDTGGLSISAEALEQLLGEDVTMVDEGTVRHVDVGQTRTDRYAELLLQAGRPMSINEVREAAGEREDVPGPAVTRALTTHEDLVAIDRGSYTHRALLGWSAAEVARLQQALVEILDGYTDMVEPEVLLTAARAAGFDLPGLNKHAVLSIATRHPEVARIGLKLAHRGTLDPTRLTLASQFPEIAAEWHPTKNGELTPLEVRPFGNTVAWWRCSKGHSFKQAVLRRVVAGQGCPTCRKTRRAR